MTPAAITSNHFSFGRLRLLLENHLHTNYRKLVLWAVLISGITLLMALLVNWGCLTSDWNREHYGLPGYDPAVKELVTWYNILLMVFAAISGSLSFSDYSTKQGRISTLTTPCLAFERWLVRFIVYYLIFVVWMVVSVFVAESLRWVVMKLIFRVDDMVTPLYVIAFNDTLLSALKVTHYFFLRTTLWSLVTATCLQAAFMLGSAIWPRLSALKTFAAMSAASVCLVVYFALLVLMVGSGSELNDPIEHASETGLMAVVMCLAALLWWLSYMRNKETDLINTAL